MISRITWVTQRTCCWLVLPWLVKWSSCGESVEWLLGALRYLHNSKSCYLPTISADSMSVTLRLFHNIFNNQCPEGICGIRQRIERKLPWLPLSSPLAIVWLNFVLTEAIFDNHIICLWNSKNSLRKLRENNSIWRNNNDSHYCMKNIMRAERESTTGEMWRWFLLDGTDNNTENVTIMLRYI